MPPSDPRPLVVIALNALRPGGSQSYTFTLADLLEREGCRCVIAAKPGEWTDVARSHATVATVRWREGSASSRRAWWRWAALRLAEELSAIQLRRTTRDAALVIASQPWPTRFAVKRRARIWPRAWVAALVHGITDVEWPPAGGERTWGGVDALLAATPESRTAVARTTGRTVTLVGNLFDASVFWDGQQEEAVAAFDPDGPITFLGTLTPNKTAPLRWLIEALPGRGESLVVVGDGPERQALTELAERHGLAGRVTFAGAQADPRPYLRRAGAVLSAGRGAIEALAIGRPVIVATSDGFSGVARAANLAELQACNFTGRAPGSSMPPSPGAVHAALSEVRALPARERAELARKVASIGDISRILDLARGTPPCANT